MLPRPPLAISIAGWPGDALSPRERIERVARWGGRGVQIDATIRGLRPRDLDRSGRRDLASLLRRLGLAFAGVDLFIPPEHFADPRHVDRALSAAGSACVLAAELARLDGRAHAAVVSTALPADLDPRILDALRAGADRAGAVLADLAWPPSPALLERAQVGGAGLGVGVDPVAVLMSGSDPAAEVASLRTPIAAARLGDVSVAGRVAPGTPGGRLDVLGYAAALHARGFAGMVTADLRGLDDAERAAGRFVASWDAGGG